MAILPNFGETNIEVQGEIYLEVQIFDEIEMEEGHILYLNPKKLKSTH